jgi:hypothetical protein
VLSYLKDMKSSRAEEFRIACDDRFKLSTLFKSAEDFTMLQKGLEEPEESQVEDSELPETDV